MCGISGIISFDGDAVEQPIIKQMTDTLHHRGPDSEGVWLSEDSRIGLGHRRLSIIDLSNNGHQPMEAFNRFVITYNGEIYNYLEIRSLLEKKGCKFTSDTDTEVLLKGYSVFGEQILQYLDGMFAFAIWDKQEKILFCARDRFGEKPFYYFYNNEKFAFASEMKAIWAIRPATKQVNNRMLFYYLAYNVVENALDQSETFYQHIQKLEAGHFIKIGIAGDIKKDCYWRISPKTTNCQIKLSEATERFNELFTLSIKRRLRADVSVGSSLSGGLDSSSVVNSIYRFLPEGATQKTFSARFHHKDYDEGKFMKMLGNTLPHLNQYFTYPTENTFFESLDKLFYHQEEPFGSASIFAQWEVMKLAKTNHVTVLLDGQGADEIIGGYHKYYDSYLRQLYLQRNQLFKLEKRAIEKMHGGEIGSGKVFLVETHLSGLKRHLGRIKRNLWKENNFPWLNKEFAMEYYHLLPPFQNFNTLNQVLHYDTFTYGLEKLLRFSDRNAMAFSREVRLPFLFHELVEFVFALPAKFKIHNGWTKFILRESMKDMLPPEITWRVDKKGFQVPFNHWKENKTLELINTCRNSLVDNNYLSKGNEDIGSWKSIMAAKLINQ